MSIELEGEVGGEVVVEVACYVGIEGGVEGGVEVGDKVSRYGGGDGGIGRSSKCGRVEFDVNYLLVLVSVLVY